jgi:hypothetical protein
MDGAGASAELWIKVEGPADALPWEHDGKLEWIEDPPFFQVFLDWHLDWFAKVSPRDSALIAWCETDAAGNTVVKSHYWYADDRSYNREHPYAVRKERRKGVVHVFRLHVEVAKRSEPMPTLFHLVDHINGDTLDDRHENLRWATRSQNAKNTKRKRATGWKPYLD